MAEPKEQLLPIEKEIRTGNVGSVLASLYRRILKDIGIDGARLNMLVERYIIKTNIPNNIKEASSLRGNIKKELFKTSMTWRIFVKGLSFLNIQKFELSVKLYHFNGRTTDHAVSVILDEVEDDEHDD